jgi:DNA-binding NarL/FixJ family response regulator
MTGEEQLANLIAAGLTDHEIASELGISPRVVKYRKSRAARRMGYKGVPGTFGLRECPFTVAVGEV